MRHTIISLIQNALYTLETQWSIDPEHLQACQSSFSLIETLLNREDSRFEEEYQEDSDSYTYNFKFNSPNGRREYHAVTLFDFDGVSSLQIYISVTPSRNAAQTTYIWNANFDEKKQLYSISVRKETDFSNSKTLWAYKNNRRLYL